MAAVRRGAIDAVLKRHGGRAGGRTGERAGGRAGGRPLPAAGWTAISVGLAAPPGTAVSRPVASLRSPCSEKRSV
jgi:hypothetical protein